MTIFSENPYTKAVDESTLYKFNPNCKLKVLVSNKPESWNGAVRFHISDTEFLRIGLRLEEQALAVRNAVFSRGILKDNGKRVVSTTYPEADSAGRREYTFEFTSTGLLVKCGDMVRIT